ncbi:MAG: helix-turn-helix domain-containing protein [Raoultibacter sp.]
MNIRQGMFLKILLDIKHFTPLSYFVTLIGCSEKTLRVDVKAINNFLEEHRFVSCVESKRGAGIRMIVEKSERSRLESLLKESSITMRPSLDHFYQGIIALVCSPKNFTVDTLAKELYTNKQQVQIDMQHWEELLKPYNLTIRKKNGIKIEGLEITIRFFVLHTFYQLASIAMKRKIEPRILEDDADFFRDIVRDVESGLGFRLADNARSQLIVYMKLMMIRIKQGARISYHIRSVDRMSPIFLDIKRKLEERFDVSIASDELALLSDMFYCCTWQWDDERIDSYLPDRQSSRITENLGQELYNRFDVALPPKIKKPLSVLIESAITRNSCKFSITSPNEKAIKFDNMDSFLLVTEVFHDSSDLRGITFFGADYARITMLLIEYLEQADLQRRYRAGLVTTCGIEQAAYGRYRIEKLCPKIHVVKALTEDEVLQEMQGDGRFPYSRFDFLITFEPLSADVPSVCITTAINEKDISRIITMLPYLTEQKHGEEPLIETIPPQSIHRETIEEILKLMHADFIEAHIMENDFERFSKLFYAQALFMGPVIIFALMSDDIKKSITCNYVIDCGVYIAGSNIKEIIVLLVPGNNHDILLSITEQFKNEISQKLKRQDMLSEFYASNPQ